ncbi:hypothetical protein LCL89_14375 [Halobacillus yeomjeoni]|uniref:hypothetical protein n=1 Tax=Halobacillus yeomjeoni TaxID=311194 RepID=UPI001CD3EAD9|nr:hypothetical protein [Halobacillus yeomjeoni]MCA0985215.1 hypothetical protein [Halobacillus yeomjeoni]
MKEDANKVELTGDWEEIAVYASENHCSKELFKQWLDNKKYTKKNSPHLKIVKTIHSE